MSNRPDLQRLFSRISGRYDTANTVLSFNQDARWRRRAIEIADPQAGQSWLDLCCGTGELALGLRRKMGEHGRIVGLDFTAAMLDIARRKESKEFGSPAVEWLEADAMRIPLADELFDGVTVGCGLRNLPDIAAALVEIARVLKPGGRFVCLELSLPQQPLWRQMHRFYLWSLFSTAGNLGLGSEKNYDWVLESLDKFPPPAALASLMEGAGFADVRFETFLGGLATIHYATRRVY